MAIPVTENLKLEDTAATNWTGTVTVESSINLYEQTQFGWAKSITDAVVLADAAQASVAIPVTENLNLQDSVATTWYGTVTIEDSINLFGEIIIGSIFNEIATESIVVTDTVDTIHHMISAISESLGLTDEIQTQLHAYPHIVESIAITGAVSILTNLQNSVSETIDLADSVGMGWGKSVSETLTLTDAPTILWHCMNILTDSIDLTEQVLGQLIVDKSLTDAIELVATAAINQALQLSVEEAINFSVIVELDGELWETWVLNTNAFHASVYSNYDFNSYTVYNNTAYGCKADGIYELSGDDDDGADIKAGVVLPETNFGTTRIKRFRKAYFGLSGGTTPAIKIETENGSRVYTISDSQANLTRDIYGKKWTLKIQDFDDLDFVDLAPIILTR